MIIKAETRIPTTAFKFATMTAQSWFPNVDIQDNICIVQILGTDLDDEGTRERLCSLCGNTPGLTDALIKSLENLNPEKPITCSLRLVICRDDEAKNPFNNPQENSERIRNALL
jgi:hypothetical protein